VDENMAKKFKNQNLVEPMRRCNMHLRPMMFFLLEGAK
jgi:hypothetical protein